MKLVDLLLYSEETLYTKEALLKAHASNLGYFVFLDRSIECTVVQHAGFKEEFKQGTTTFRIFKSKNHRWKLYTALFFKIRKEQPDVILIHSFIYAWQILILRLIVGKRVRLIVQNHAEKPFNGMKQQLQKLADRYISAYLFVSHKQAEPWLNKKIISSEQKIYEVMEGSTSFTLNDKHQAKMTIAEPGTVLFLWVGRLDQNKDPLTVLKAFKSYWQDGHNAKLIMIYNSYELLKEVEEFITVNNLSDCILLKGSTEHSELEVYYNAADYFILGSHDEGSGYALCEAMACGCVPVVTTIPSFMNMLNNGQCGYVFEPGNVKSLYDTLCAIDPQQLPLYRKSVLNKFSEDLSHEAIGKKISAIVKKLSQK